MQCFKNVIVYLYKKYIIIYVYVSTFKLPQKIFLNYQQKTRIVILRLNLNIIWLGIKVIMPLIFGYSIWIMNYL